MKIVADCTVPYLKGAAETFAQVRYIAPGEFVRENISDADVLIVRSIDKCTREVLENTRVKLITTATIGFDHIDTAYCEAAGIRWVNAPGCNAVSVGQYILASLIVTARKTGEPLAGKTLGIIGAGHVGTQVERLAEAFGLRVLRNDPPRALREGAGAFVSLKTIAEEADIVTVHTPLTRSGEFPTFHLAGRSFFGSLRRRPWFINAARGAVHDTEALLEAKKEGTVSELILDCWENEPRIDRELLRLAAVATPHIAGFSADGKANGTRMCLEAIGRFYGLEVERISRVVPPAPAEPVIDLDAFSGNRIEEAVLATFDPLRVDRRLRESPEKFEFFRNNYDHPREFSAYTVRNARPEEAEMLRELGFRVEEAGKEMGTSAGT